MSEQFVYAADVLTNGSSLFRPKHERITKQEVEEIIESYKRMKWWP